MQLLKISLFTFLLCSLCTSNARGQNGLDGYRIPENYGIPHPDAPAKLLDYQEMIGTCDCESVRRNPDGTWQDTVEMIWHFKYILAGHAIQDETWQANGRYATSIRQFNQDSTSWFVTFFSSAGNPGAPTTWQGKRMDNEIKLSAPQKAPNGMSGVSRLTFYDITNSGFKWKGEWVKDDGSFVYPFWTIDCRKRNARSMGRD